ncbi:hypothetical protein ACWF5H_14780 [Arthrobacter sp. NPDC055138]
MDTAAALLLFAAITIYAIFGGADFGAGFWDLTPVARSVGSGLAR